MTPFSDFEPETWRDYALIPWWLLRYAFAWLWSTLVWHPALDFQIWLWPWRLSWLPWLPSFQGRHTDPDPVMCRRCLWAGMRRWCVHGYAAVGEDDVEPCDYCPRCGGEM